MKCLCLKVSGTIDEQILTEFLDKMPNIEQLSLKGRLSHFSLDNFYNLKKLSLNGTINDDFNFELFKNLCYQLERLSFSLIKDYEIIEKLLAGHRFPNLELFSIRECEIRRVKKNFIDHFPALIYLTLSECNLETIESGAFSNIKQIVHLDLSCNLLKTLEKQTFSDLTNLELLYLRSNPLEGNSESIDKDMFTNMKHLNEHNWNTSEYLQSYIQNGRFFK